MWHDRANLVGECLSRELHPVGSQGCEHAESCSIGGASYFFLIGDVHASSLAGPQGCICLPLQKVQPSAVCRVAHRNLKQSFLPGNSVIGLLVKTCLSLLSA